MDLIVGNSSIYYDSYWTSTLCCPHLLFSKLYSNIRGCIFRYLIDCTSLIINRLNAKLYIYSRLSGLLKWTISLRSILFFLYNFVNKFYQVISPGRPDIVFLHFILSIQLFNRIIFPFLHRGHVLSGNFATIGIFGKENIFSPHFMY